MYFLLSKKEFSTFDISQINFEKMFSENSASFAAGAFAGLVTDLTLHPLDTIKTRLQAGVGSISSSATAKTAASKRSLFQGLTPALCGSCPSGAFFFGTYQFISRKLDELENKNNNKHGSTSSSSNIIYKSLIASCLGEASACLVRAPVDIVKNNMQVGKSGTESIGLLFASRRKFLKVYQALLFRELPFAMLQLPTLELLKQNPIVQCVAYHLSSEYWNIIEDKKVAATVVAGFFAGGSAAFVTTPSDVYKTRNAVFQNDGKVVYKMKFRDFLFKSSVRELFTGGMSRVVMISVGGSIFFGTQEWARRKLLLF